MKRFKHFFLFDAIAVSLTGLMLISLIAGCSSDSSTSASATITETASLGTTVKNVQLQTNVPTEIKFSYTIPGDISSRGDYSVNLTKTLENMTLSSAPIADSGNRLESLQLLAYALIKQAFAAETAEVTAYISFAGDPNVCSSPYMFGPYSIMGAIGAALTSDTTTVEPGQAAVDISNAGSFEICVVTTPPIDGYITVSGVAMDIEDCAPPTVDIVGNWTGTFTCDGSTPAFISLDITQNVDGSYHYNDGIADYDGHLCGNKYKFNGGLAGDYTESGTLVVNGSSATKTSNWQSVTTTTVYGSCTDDLNKT